MFLQQINKVINLQHNLKKKKNFKHRDCFFFLKSRNSRGVVTWTRTALFLLSVLRFFDEENTMFQKCLHCENFSENLNCLFFVVIWMFKVNTCTISYYYLNKWDLGIYKYMRSQRTHILCYVLSFHLLGYHYNITILHIRNCKSISCISKQEMLTCYRL